MAAEFTEITDSNQPEILRALDHVMTDLHEALELLRTQGKIQARHDAMLTEFAPLLAQFRTPLAGAMTRRRGRHSGRADIQ